MVLHSSLFRSAKNPGTPPDKIRRIDGLSIPIPQVIGRLLGEIPDSWNMFQRILNGSVHLPLTKKAHKMPSHVTYMSPQNAPQNLGPTNVAGLGPLPRRYAKTIFCTNLAASVASKKCPAALSSTLVTGATMTCGYLGGGWKF